MTNYYSSIYKRNYLGGENFASTWGSLRIQTSNPNSQPTKLKWQFVSRNYPYKALVYLKSIIIILILFNRMYKFPLFWMHLAREKNFQIRVINNTNLCLLYVLVDIRHHTNKSVNALADSNRKPYVYWEFSRVLNWQLNDICFSGSN